MAVASEEKAKEIIVSDVESVISDDTISTEKMNQSQKERHYKEIEDDYQERLDDFNNEVA